MKGQMNPSLEIRRAKEDWFHTIFCAVDSNGNPVEDRDTYGALGEQTVAIVLGWADPVEVGE